MGGKNKIITIIDKKSKRKDKRIFTVEKGIHHIKIRKLENRSKCQVIGTITYQMVVIINHGTWHRVVTKL